MHYRHRLHRRRSSDETGHAHTLTFTCYHRYTFLQSERTCQWLSDAIDAARKKHKFALWAFVFMPEHAHLIVWPGERKAKVAQLLQSIKQPVGQRAIGYLRRHAPEWIPRLQRWRGDQIETLFWQSGGGFDRDLVEPRTLMSAIEYIHANPVRRGLVDLPTDCRWSSAGWYEGKPTVDLACDPIPADWRLYV